MHRLIRFTLFLLFVLIASACEIINPEEEIPAYVTIENPLIEVDSVAGFQAPYGLKDVWVTNNGNVLGVFEPPVTFPYLDPQNTDIMLEAGINESGQSAFKLPYPFLEPIVVNASLNPKDTLKLTPVFKYRPGSEIVFAWDENFESGPGVSLDPFGAFNNTTTFARYNGDSYQGNFSGRAVFNADSMILQMTSTQSNPFQLASNVDVYLEITYKSDFDLMVGLVGQSSTDVRVKEGVVLLPKDEWTTVYVHLVQQVRELNSEIGLNQLFVWFFADGEGNSGEILVDNLRLVHFRN